MRIEAGNPGRDATVTLELDLASLMEVYAALVGTDLESPVVRRFVGGIEGILFDRLSMEEMAELNARRRDA